MATAEPKPILAGLVLQSGERSCFLSGPVPDLKMLVSAIIATHNRAGLLQEALDSVFAQQGAGEQFDLEVIVVDDASSDSTSEVVRRHLTVKYLRFDSNRGLSAAWNAGVAASAGDYVAFLDDDDLWLPHKLRAQVSILDAHSEFGVAYSQVVENFEDIETVRPKAESAPSGWVFRAMLTHSIACTPALLIRREAFERVGDFDEALTSSMDHDMWLRLAFHFPFVFVPGPVAVYRRSRQGMALTTFAERRFGSHRFVIKKALSMLPKTEENAGLEREAISGIDLSYARTLALIGNFEDAITCLGSALRSFPELVSEDRFRSSILWMARRLGGGDTPIVSGRAFCKEIKAAAGGRGGIRQLLRTRRLLAVVWTEVAVGLGSRSRRQYRAAAYAAVLATLHDPATLMRRALPWLVRKAALRPRSTFRRMFAKKTAH